MKKIFLIPMAFLFFSNFIFAQEAEKTKYTLEELENLMKEKNTDLRSAREEYSKSILDYKDAKAGLFPKVEFQASGTYMTNPPIDAIVLNVDDIVNSMQWTSGYSPVSTGQYITLYEGMENTLYNFQLTLEQPVWTWGKLTDAVKVYDKISQVKKLQLTSKEDELKCQLKTRLNSLVYLNKISELLEEEQSCTKRMLEVAEDAEKNGMLTHIEVVESRMQAKELDIGIEEVKDQIQKQLFELQKLTGIENFTLDMTENSFNEEELLKLIEKPLEELESLALEQSTTSLQMLTLLKEINETALQIQKNSVYWKPDFAIQASAGYAGSRLPLFEPNWRRKDDWSLNLSIGMKTTVFDGGKKINAIARAQNEVEDAGINEDAARQTIRKTIQEQYSSAQNSTIKIEYQELKIESLEEKVKQEQMVFDSGYGSETDLLKIKVDLYNAKVEKLRQEITRLVSLYTIDYLITKNKK